MNIITVKAGWLRTRKGRRRINALLALGIALRVAR